MRLNDLKPGNKLEMEIYSNTGDKIQHTLISEFEWAESDSKAIIAAPIFEGIIYPVQVGTNTDIFFAHSHGKSGRMEMYRFRAVVTGRNITDNIAMLEIEISSEIEKVQRREFFRFECYLPLRYRPVIPVNKEQNEEIDYKNAYTRDISGGGLCFVTDEKLDLHKTVEMEVTLQEGDVKTFLGTVVRVNTIEKIEKKSYEIGVWFKKMDIKVRESLIKYIFTEQRKLRKKGLI